MTADEKTKHALEHIGERGQTSRQVRFTTEHRKDGTTVVRCSHCEKEWR